MYINVKQKNRKKIILFLSLSVFFLVLNLLPIHLINERGFVRNEKFESTLDTLNTIEKLVKKIDDSASYNHLKSKTLEYNEIVTTIIKRRFHHGYSHYGFNENWVACMMGRFIWRDLSAIVDPNDLMKYQNAACSQQAIVMMEVLKIKQIPFCKVGWNHHFTLCAWVNNKWCYYDPNMEPIITTKQRQFDNRYLNIEFLSGIYAGKIKTKDIALALGVPQMGEINDFPAPHILLFHKITKLISITFWLVFLLPALFWYRPIHIKTKKIHHNIFKLNHPKTLSK